MRILCSLVKLDDVEINIVHAGHLCKRVHLVLRTAEKE